MAAESRAYNSELRRAQVESTRRRILDALAEVKSKKDELADDNEEVVLV